MKKRMKVICAAYVFISLLVVPPGPMSQAQQSQTDDKARQVGIPFVPGRVLVKFRPGLLGLSANDLIAEVGARDAGQIARTDVHIIELPEGADENAMVHALQARPDVEFAELDRAVPP
jgi:hypothetical protein